MLVARSGDQVSFNTTAGGRGGAFESSMGSRRSRLLNVAMLVSQMEDI